MLKEVRYNGYTANTSDYECADGDLDCSFGLANENSHQEPIFAPKQIIKLRENEEIVLVHKTSTYTHYISIKNNGTSVYWFSDDITEVTDDNAMLLMRFRDDEQFVRATAIGNTLIVITKYRMMYFLWRETTEDESDYFYLGEKLPEVPISFGLCGTMVREAVTLSFSSNYDLSSMQQTLALTDSDKTSITRKALAAANKFIAEQSTANNKFLFPFFVRYALRLYDGNIVMHSAPVLMITYTSIPIKLLSSSSIFSSPYLSGIIHDLDYQALISDDEFATLKEWKDVIASVDIFISKPIYSYDQNGEVTRFVIEHVIDNINDHSTCKKEGETTYGRQNFFDWYKAKYGVSEVRLLELPTHSDEIFNKYITDNSTFYFLKSIPIKELSISERKIIDIPENHLSNLLVQEVMTDDYDSHDRLIPNFSYVYNNRLHLAGLQKEIFSGFRPKSINPYVTENGLPRLLEIYYHLKINGKKIVVKSTDLEFGDDIGYDADLVYIYYPSTYAYQVEIIETRNIFGGVEFRKITKPLKQHPYLNGSYYFERIDIGAYPYIVISNNDPSEPVSKSRNQVIDSKIYSSEINNPFYYPLLGINNIGTGNIIALATVTQALSQGQFGQYPLYAFTTEGVWALEISSIGGFTSVHPVTRDILISEKSLTQIDNAVLFATEQGIMQLSGSSTICISENLTTEIAQSWTSLPKIDILSGNYQDMLSTNISMTTVPFSDFIRGCQMIYDYNNARIIVFNPLLDYSYVYSLRNKTWGLTHSNLFRVVLSYPNAFAVSKDWTLIDLSKSSEQTTPVLMVTRPMKLGMPDVLKTVSTVVQRGEFNGSKVCQILYGSNDLRHWHIVYSSNNGYMTGFRGTPYKYFRIALFGRLSKGESIYGCVIEYNPRMTNRLR